MAQPPSNKPADGPSPTVRVMRLYKPPMHITPCMPQLCSDELSDRNLFSALNYPDFTISQHLMLPDSFGDIYLSELFSAYISVINGVPDLPYNSVTLTARLQTLNATHDLFDSRAIDGEDSGRVKVLFTGESVDMVVQHTLSELGTHTLRVSVTYTDSKTNETKTLRKFYRFNVLNPLTILVANYDLSDRYMVQCQVTNITKALINIQQIQLLLPTSTPLETPQLIPPPSTPCCTPSPPPSFPLDTSALPILSPDESFAYAFSIPKKPPSNNNIPPPMVRSLGVVEVHWVSSMGENARTRSDEICVGKRVSFLPTALPSSPNTAPASLPSSPRRSTEHVGLHGSGLSPEQRSNTLHMEAIRYKDVAHVGSAFPITIRLTNYFSYPILSQLQGRLDAGMGGFAIVGLSYVNIGALDPGESRLIDLTLLPVNGGMHSIVGIVAVDLTSKAEFLAGSLCQVMVYDPALSPPFLSEQPLLVA